MPNFYLAAIRHLNDGDFLHQFSRTPNAVQLWAYGSECVLKSIAQRQNHFSLKPNGKPTNGFDIHIDKLDLSSQQLLLSIYNATQSGPNGILGPTSAFLGWKIDARYEDGSQLAATATYQNDAIQFRSLLNLAILQGVLP
jgi:hypothetical protein